MLTISAGVAAFTPGATGSLDQPLEQADTALYRAKAAGRNRVVVFDDVEDELRAADGS